MCDWYGTFDCTLLKRFCIKENHDEVARFNHPLKFRPSPLNAIRAHFSPTIATTSLWARSTKRRTINHQPDESTGPLTRPFTRTAHSFACSGLLASLARSAALTRLLACSLCSLPHWNDWMAIYSVFSSFLAHSVVKERQIWRFLYDILSRLSWLLMSALSMREGEREREREKERKWEARAISLALSSLYCAS